MSFKLKISLIFLVLLSLDDLSFVAGSPVNKADDEKCDPDFCKVAKFKCISEDFCKSRNMTLVQGTGPCDCCPHCIKFRGEGDPCELLEDVKFANMAESSSKTPSDVSSTENTTVAVVSTSQKSKDEKKDSTETEEEVRFKETTECRPGLTCLVGVCVIIF